MTSAAPLLAAVLWITGSNYTLAQRKVDPAELKVGSHVEISIKETAQGNRRSTMVYLGKVKTVTGESLTLQDVTKTIRTESSTPVLRSIPYVNRYFRKGGTGQTSLGKRTVVIPLADIAKTEILTPIDFRKRSAPSRERALVR
jgi:hypothetical protein